METNNGLPETVQRVAELLKTFGHDKGVVMLNTTGKTSHEAAVALGCNLEEIAKSIVFRRLSDNAAVMVVASGLNKIDENKVAKIVGGNIAKANAKFVKENIGYAIGGVCPIGHAKPSIVLIDKGLLELDSVWAAAGHPHAVFNLTPSQLVAMTVAPIVDVALS
jgi:prolyl-tRNA editing enzyme YbaK/EbsC (Cys-tRNA(Pro) deacylase)